MVSSLRVILLHVKTPIAGPLAQLGCGKDSPAFSSGHLVLSIFKFRVHMFLSTHQQTENCFQVTTPTPRCKDMQSTADRAACCALLACKTEWSALLHDNRMLLVNNKFTVFSLASILEATIGEVLLLSDLDQATDLKCCRLDFSCGSDKGSKLTTKLNKPGIVIV